ncbi:MAG: isocitrate/isopropylmalate dehydrogenase family protein [Deltaproteobacteria bacterium]|jgi:3-isopropylmalate dehydrogenase|nr:isocitrate/isopropylmalate dehydrogenase family protein [Deltaproteobacteria bacterium]
MPSYEIAVIPGDGIGPEVIREALRALDALAPRFGFTARTKSYPFGAEHYLKTKEILPPGAFDDLGAAQALLLGAVGDPRVPHGPLEQGLLLAIRFRFDQYLNIRPARTWPKAPIPVNIPEEAEIDILVVRENTEDFYMNLGGVVQAGKARADIPIERGLYKGAAKVEVSLDPPAEGAFTLGLLTSPATLRVAHKAFALAEGRGERVLHCATKSNALPHLYGFWDRTVAEAAVSHPEVKLRPINVDNLAYQLSRSPQNYGLILCPNLFGDIVSDLAAGVTGGLGLAASANIGEGLSMFEPVHGSAPDIAGTGKANPLAAILSVSLMLGHLGEKDAALALEEAVGLYLNKSPRGLLPYELNGGAACSKVGDLVVQAVEGRL